MDEDSGLEYLTIAVCVGLTICCFGALIYNEVKTYTRLREHEERLVDIV